MKIADIPAGRLLDCLMACAINPQEKLFAFREGNDTRYTIRWQGTPPPYSTEWSAAGEYLQLLLNSGFTVGQKDGNAPVEIFGRMGSFSGGTLPEAICHAVIQLRLGANLPEPTQFGYSPWNQTDRMLAGMGAIPEQISRTPDPRA